MKEITVNWCVDKFMNEPGNWLDLAVIEPEPVFKHIVNDRTKETEYLQCPAFQDYYKNTFLVRSPIDLKITIGVNGFINTHHYDQQFFDHYVTPRYNPDKHNFVALSVELGLLFFSDDSVIVEQLHPGMEDTDLVRNIRVIPGRFDISKWIRPIEFSFEVVDRTKEIILKRGDPLYYIKFITPDNSKVNLKRVENTAELQHVVKSSLSIKKYLPNNSLKENYKLAAPLIEIFKKKNKSKCPFHFWKK